MNEVVEKLSQVTVGALSLAVSREAQIRAEVLKVGDPVRVLKKKHSGYDVHTGVIVGFEPFEKRPTVIIAYIENEYGTHKLQTLAYSADTEDVEIIAAVPGLALSVERAKVLEWFTSERRKLQGQLDELCAKQAYFEKHFGQLFEEIEQAAA